MKKLFNKSANLAPYEFREFQINRTEFNDTTLKFKKMKIVI